MMTIDEAIKHCHEVAEWLEELKKLRVQPFQDADVKGNQKHSKWEISSDGYYPYCGRCKAEPELRKMTDYCPNCGARMDGDSE